MFACEAVKKYCLPMWHLIIMFACVTVKYYVCLSGGSYPGHLVLGACITLHKNLDKNNERMMNFE